MMIISNKQYDETINDNPFSSFTKIIQSPTILAFNEIPTNELYVITWINMTF